ncbi:hypothetical protein EMCRGX_G005110 [Ephydatia muelleri]
MTPKPTRAVQDIHEDWTTCEGVPWGLTATTKPTRAVQSVHNHCPECILPYGGAYSHSSWSRMWAWDQLNRMPLQ